MQSWVLWKCRLLFWCSDGLWCEDLCLCLLSALRLPRKHFFGGEGCYGGWLQVSGMALGCSCECCQSLWSSSSHISMCMPPWLVCCIKSCCHSPAVMSRWYPPMKGEFRGSPARALAGLGDGSHHGACFAPSLGWQGPRASPALPQPFFACVSFDNRMHPSTVSSVERRGQDLKSRLIKESL